jgi:di/tricarboxylate transporter
VLPQLTFVLVVLGGAICCFALDRFRMDVVGFGALTLLLLGGVLSVPEALAGFADPTVHMIAGLFVVGGAVFQTGLADSFGKRLEKMGAGSPKKLVLTIMLAAALLSAFLSSTGTVALMVPVVTMLARRARLSASKLMIPLAYATLLGGLLTLIATPPNMVVSNALASAGFAPFGFFEFTGPGVCLVALGIGFVLLFGDRLLPVRVPPGSTTLAPTPHELWTRYGLEGWVSECRILPGSPLIGASIAESEIRTRFGVAIFAVRPGSRSHEPVERAQAERILEARQVLTVKGNPEAVARFVAEAHLESLNRLHELPNGLIAAQLLVPPGSSLIGKTVAESRLRTRFDVTVLAVFRSREVLRESVAQTTVNLGDLLLLIGTVKSLIELREALPDAILINDSESLKDTTFRTEKAPVALVVLGAMMLSMAFELTPPVVAVVAAAFAMVLFGCLDGKQAERAIKWESVLLIATIIPVATALTNVGAIDIVVKGLVDGLGTAGPYVILSALFFVTALVSLFISNTATAVLVSPIAVQVASNLGVQPHALLMTVAIASSAAFVTPVSSPVNMLVVNAGGYRFSDFARLGVPLLIVIWLGSLVVLPLFFPFAR